MEKMKSAGENGPEGLALFRYIPDWGLVICSLGGAFAVFAMVFEGARRSFLSSKWSVWRAGGVLTGKLGTWVDYGSVSSLKTGPR